MIRRQPSLMDDLVSREGLSEEEGSLKCRKLIDSKIQSIERNETWNLTTLLSEAQAIGVKWIYKTKMNKK